MKKLLSILLIIAVMLSVPVFSYGTTETPALIGETAILMDMTTGKILYEKNANDTRYPASCTKIMTALLALENLDVNKTVTVDDKTPYEVEGSHIALVPGEQLTVDQLLHAMMTESANDCALVLGKEISGTTEDFAALMNQRAKELGAKNTNFVNPNGLHNDAHVSTAYDLAMIARYAMTNPETSQSFRELVTTYKYYIAPTNKQPERFLYNTNRLLYDTVNKVVVNGEKRVFKYDGVTGVKTGYTSHAGGCLVASAERNGTELLAVVMKSTDPGRFADCMALMDWGFANFKTVPALTAGKDLGETKVKKGSVNQVQAVLAEDVSVTLPAEASENVISTKVLLDETVNAPVEKGQTIGTVEIYEGDNLVTTVGAVAAKTVTEGGLLSYVGIPDKTAKKIGLTVLAVFLVLIAWLVIYIMIKRRQVRLRRERRRLRAERRRREEIERRAAWEAEYERQRRDTWQQR